jgi:hypothetical protein
MLTYSRVCCAFSSIRASSLSVICIFEIASSKIWNKARNNYIFGSHTSSPEGF